MILLDGVFTLAFMGVCCGAGLSILRWVGHPPPQRTARWLFGFAVGFFVLTHGIMVLGFAHRLTPSGLWGWFFLLSLASIPGWWFEWKNRSSETAGGVSPVTIPLPSRTLVRTAFWLFLALCLFNWVFAYSPPKGGDEVFYHLTIPKLSLERNQFAAFDDLPFSFLPMTAQAGYTFLMGVRNDIVARCLHAVFGVLSVLVLSFMTKEIFKVPWAVTASLAYLTPLFVCLSGRGDSDFFALFYVLLSVWAFMNHREEGKSPWLLLGSFCGGAAISIKYQSVPFVIAILLSEGALWWTAAGRLRRPSLQTGILCLALFLGAFAFTPIRNLVLKGNPIYPLGTAPDDYFGLLFQASKIPRTVEGLLRIPRTVAFGNVLFDGMGPLFAALLPLVLVFPPKGAEEWKLSGTILIGVVLSWALFSVTDPRFFLGGSALLVVLLSKRVWEMVSRPVRPPAWFAGLLLVGVLPGLALGGGYAVNRVRFAMGLESRETFLRRANYPLIPWAFVEKVNGRVPPEETVFFLAPAGQFLYWKPSVHSLDQRLLWEEKDVRRVLESFQGGRYRYFIFPGPRYETTKDGSRFLDSVVKGPYTIRVPWLTEDFLKTHFQEIAREDGFRLLYRHG